MDKKTASKLKTLTIGLSLGLILFIAGYIVGSLNLNPDVKTSTLEPALEPAEKTITLDPATPDTPTPLDALTANYTGPDYTQEQGSENNHYYIGNKNAPVTVIEYADFQCPFCQRYFFESFQQIKDGYIKTGKVKYIFKNLPLDFHPKARPAAYALYCAGEQGKFWDMHAKLYTYQTEWAYAEDTPVVFTKYANELKIDTDTFKQCFQNAAKNYDSIIDQDSDEATNYGLSGTPSFLINGTPLVGAQPFVYFSSLIDPYLQ